MTYHDKKVKDQYCVHTVDGRNPAPVEVVSPSIYKVLYIPGGEGLLPWTVAQ